MTKSADYGFRPATGVQRVQLGRIQYQNDAFAAKKKKKKTDVPLPEIPSGNTVCKSVLSVDMKKKQVEIKKKYHQVGIVDPFLPMGNVDNVNTEAAAFSMRNQLLEVKQKEAKQKIRNLRQNVGKLINATDDKMKDSKNVWHEGQAGDMNGNISLSCFSKVDNIRRPKTAVYDKFNKYIGQGEDLTEQKVTGGVKGLRTITVDEDGKEVIEEEPEEQQEGVIPEFDLPEDLQPM